MYKVAEGVFVDKVRNISTQYFGNGEYRVQINSEFYYSGTVYLSYASATKAAEDLARNIQRLWVGDIPKEEIE